MPDQSIIEIAIGLATAALGWVVKMIWGAQKDQRSKHDELANKVSDVEVRIAGQYVRRDELANQLSSMEAKIDRNFQRIFDKLDAKADKT